MANLSFLALATVLGVAAGDAVARPQRRTTLKLGNRQLRRGDPAAEALLRHARPYRRPDGRARRLDEEFEIDGSYSLKFSQCVDARTYDEDLFDEDLVEYAQAGQVVSSKSYVLFHVCQDDDCYYDAEDDLYVVDLPTYLANVATYHANKRNDYCEQCERFDDYCNPEDEEDEGEDEDDEDEEGGEDEEGDDADEEEGNEEEEEDEAEDEGDDERNDEEEEGANEGEVPFPQCVRVPGMSLHPTHTPVLFLCRRRQTRTTRTRRAMASAS